MAANAWDLSLRRNIVGAGSPKDFKLKQSTLERLLASTSTDEVDLLEPVSYPPANGAVVKLSTTPVRDAKVEDGDSMTDIEIKSLLGGSKETSDATVVAPAARLAREATLSQVDSIASMTVIELKELLDAFEEKFDVFAAAPAAVPRPGTEPAEATEEKTEFDVILNGAGGQKIQVIKVVKDLLGVGLKDAKDLVDGAPKPLLQKASRVDAEAVRSKLEEAGAEVEIT